MTTSQWLFTLLREALWGEQQEEPIPPKSLSSILNEARRQTVSGLVIDQLFKHNVQMPKQMVYESFSWLERIKQQNRKMNGEVAEFAKMMKRTSTRYIIVKGQTLAALYPEPLLRVSGDIDFLVNNYAEAKIVLEKNWKVALPEFMVEKEISFEHNSALYELHTYLIDFARKRHQNYWEKALAESKSDSIIIDGEQVAVMNPTLSVAYVFIHLFYHFVKEGIGLRHLCDWAVALHYYRHEIDEQYLKEVLSQIGLKKAYCAFGSILTDYLGLDYFPFEICEKDRRLQKCILHDIFSGGNFGRDNRQVKRYGMKYKAETFWLTLKNSYRYFQLAPTEMFFLMHRRIIVNMKLLLNKLFHSRLFKQ